MRMGGWLCSNDLYSTLTYHTIANGQGYGYQSSAFGACGFGWWCVVLVLVMFPFLSCVCHVCHDGVGMESGCERVVWDWRVTFLLWRMEGRMKKGWVIGLRCFLCNHLGVGGGDDGVVIGPEGELGGDTRAVCIELFFPR